MVKRSGNGAKSYSANPSDYQRLEEIGNGASATVYRAIYIPTNEVVAIKCLDLDRCNSNLDDMRREAQTMSLIDHPNVVRAYCSFVVDRDLWVVMPYMAEGSCLHLIKIAHPDGFEEPTIRTILRETLKALDYLHKDGHIHRDVKAGNILLDSNGAVKLGDFGVTACMFDNGDRQRARKTFVGTPCWMAPEVLQPDCGYDFKADIWSFGITALELARGHAPFSKYPPMKVLMMTIQYAPPGLNYERDKKFSKSFRELVAMCLVKDPKKRPTVEKLLKHSFFKHTKPPEVSVKKLFADLPSLGERVKTIQMNDAASLASKKMPSLEQEALSQSEYQRGVSAWNFDIDDLKVQASLIRDHDEISDIREGDESEKSVHSYKGASFHGSCSDEALPTSVNVSRVTCALELGSVASDQKVAEQTEIQPQPTKWMRTQSGPLIPGIVSEKSSNLERSENGNLPTTGKSAKNMPKEPSYSGLLLLPNRASANSLSAPIRSSALDDKAKASLVQIKGRFSVTSANVDIVKDIPLCSVPVRSQGSSLKKSASVGEWMCDVKQPDHSSKNLCNGNLPPSPISPHLQNLLQQTSIQKDFIMNLVTNLQSSTEACDAPPNGNIPPLPFPRSSENRNIEAESSEQERLIVRISELQNRTDSLTEELKAEKEKYYQLQQQLAAFSDVEGNNGRTEN
ncbi:hypothetical protein V2J09_004870 [Rumex salicifolius]